MIANRRVVVSRTDVGDVLLLSDAVRRAIGSDPLRWYVADVTDESIVIEATVSDLPAGRREIDEPEATPIGRSVLVNLVPTGIGCSIGGFAGDAAPANAVLAATCDVLVTNPNTVNASNFAHIPSNMIYAEGRLIDQWLSGSENLFRPRANRIGVVVEACPPPVLTTILSVIDAVRAVHGVDVVGYALTEGPIGTTCVRNPSGAYVGTVTNPGELLGTARRLLDGGANAIAVASRIQGLASDSYALHFQGGQPNPVGGAEAVVSHLVTHALGVPCAHAPIANFRDFPHQKMQIDPRGAAEYASESGLACVLIGLRQAPQLQAKWGLDALARGDVRAVIAPATALGGVATLEASRNGIPVIALEENQTVLKVTAESLGMPGVLKASSYLEAAGLSVALGRGISFASLGRPLAPVERIG